MATQSQRRQQTREHLLAAAEAAFVDRGFHGVSVDAIAEAAGYSKGAVYGRFGGKDGLFLAVVERRFEARASQLQGAWSQDSSLEENLVNAFRAQGRLLAGDTQWAAAWLEFLVHATREPDTLMELRELDQRLVRHAARDLAAHSGLAEVDGDFLTAVALVFGSGLMVERLLAPDSIDDEDLSRLGQALAGELEKRADA